MKFKYREKRRMESIRFQLMRRVAMVLVPSYRFKWPQMVWWGDEFFNDYLQRFGEEHGMNTDRHWMLHQLLRLVDHVEGDTAECGVFRGASSFLMCTANLTASCGNRWHHAFDSFAGISVPSVVDGEHWAAGNLACELDLTKRNLSQFERVKYYEGW